MRGLLSCAQRPAVDLAIAGGNVESAAIGEKYSLHPDAVWRHGQNHLSPEVKAALALKLVRKEGDVRAVLLEEGAGAVRRSRAIRAPLFDQFLTRGRCW